jgi:hypothetical protein
MEPEQSFPQIDPDLQHVFAELRNFEPIFHREAFGKSIEEFCRRMAPDYWEIGASGRIYRPEFILKTLEENPPVDAQTAGWVCSDFGLRSLGPESFLLTYTLNQSGRITRRATIWTRDSGEWRILFH